MPSARICSIERGTIDTPNPAATRCAIEEWRPVTDSESQRDSRDEFDNSFDVPLPPAEAWPVTVEHPAHPCDLHAINTNKAEDVPKAPVLSCYVSSTVDRCG